MSLKQQIRDLTEELHKMATKEITREFSLVPPQPPQPTSQLPQPDIIQESQIVVEQSPTKIPVVQQEPQTQEIEMDAQQGHLMLQMKMKTMKVDEIERLRTKLRVFV